MSYDKQFYGENAGDSFCSAQAIVPIIVKLFHPSSILDVGCGQGLWLQVFMQGGIDVLGIDGPWAKPIVPHILADLEQPFTLDRKFDMAMSLETAEHLSESAGEQLVSILCNASNVIVFSAAPPGQVGENHINLQPLSYWKERFEKHGFELVDCLRSRIGHISIAANYYKNNIVVFVKGFSDLDIAKLIPANTAKVFDTKVELESVNCEVTSLCNARCIMCPHERISRLSYMPQLNFQRVVDEAVDMGTRFFNLAQYGEPLIDKCLEERVEYITKHGANAFFFTNGSLMTRERARGLLDAGLKSIAFSIDGATKETYEKIRLGLNFDQTYRNVHGFIEEAGGKCEVRIHMVAQAENIHEIPLMPKVWGGNGVLLTWVPRENRDGKGALMDASDDLPCHQPFKNLIVHTDGQVVMCCQDWNAEMTLGNVFENNVSQVWRGRLFEKLRAKHIAGKKKELPLCKRCFSSY
jgi:radical SAM protein with 4Fe4S-binding SPASM domain